MPPVRTEKTTSHADAPAPVAETPMRRLLKPVTRGIKDAEFRSSEYDWDNNYHRLIGTTTKTVSFGSQFVLTDEHIEEIALLTRRVREKITHFSFKYTDVSYDAKNDAKQVTNHGIILLSKSLPNLKVLELPGTKLITDDGLIGLFQNCSQMKNLEVSGSSYGGGPIEGNALDELRAHPEWVPGLKSLKLVDNESNKVFMTAMKEMSRARPALAISLVSRSEEKNYGDWDLEVSSKHFKNGRKSSAKPRGDRFMSQDFGLYGGGGRYGSFYGRY
ncbi:Ff.00g021930.m01.CDS01 [Fusarium sp. VM40]|nr:Ff.00g021930.m01.CDS01 [Fusarium sp. VM40]